jgi:hypothetical protein
MKQLCHFEWAEARLSNVIDGRQRFDDRMTAYCLQIFAGHRPASNGGRVVALADFERCEDERGAA